MITMEQIETVPYRALFTAAETYLADIGEKERAEALGETWGETAARVGGDAVLEAAERRWRQFESQSPNTV